MANTKIDQSLWYVGDTPDPDLTEFVSEIQQTIINKITNQIRHHPDLKIEIGPYDLNARGSSHPVLFALNMRGTLLEVNLRDRSNVHNPNKKSLSGFRIMKPGNKQIYTLSGLINYINEIWIPSQEDIVRRAKNRQSYADEFAEAISGFTSKKYAQKDLSSLVHSIVIPYSQSTSTYELEYSIIADKSCNNLLEQYGAEGSYWKLSQSTLAIKFIWVALKKGQNMAQVGYFYPQTVNGYSNKSYTSYRTIKSGWFSPKNVMSQLNKLASKAPCLAVLLADPSIGAT